MRRVICTVMECLTPQKPTIIAIEIVYCFKMCLPLKTLLAFTNAILLQDFKPDFRRGSCL